ncbi:MAG: hypothetical protein HYV97_10580 [Bdellovibrio sp.]|nr:hypothetical protein [Bdellovibrio sp.]
MNKFDDHNWKLDWVGEWFPIIRSFGEFTDIVYLKCSSAGAVEDIYYLDHGQYDGVGGFQVLLEQQQCPNAIYRAQTESRSNFFWRCLGFIKYFLESKANSINWKRREHSLPGKKMIPCVFVYSVEQTNHLMNLARSKQVTLTALILQRLDECVRTLLQNEQKKNIWLIPVNMRASVKRKNPYSNHASYISVTLSRFMQDADVGKTLKTALKIGYHWAAWWGILLGRMIGLNGMHRLMKKYHDKKHSWTGTLSNLGVWSHPNADQTWAFCPPLSKSHPVALGLVTWNGQLSMALQIHPSLDQEGVLAKQLLHTLQESVLH